ncbi:DUF3102 domain-containing protein [Zhenpiania hominis]|uniref:DUF3102 domain-containing protein n=1 Tax=Zhenpiania hominis TaxID=2763644 RepID=A0A923NP73_9FIRM|nr:DUF3102 domain-containing protein [Zhenpiania hominis]MBC6679583.1 DUF3102 domain-containing protein [Zhenpiania hominis]
MKKEEHTAMATTNESFVEMDHSQQETQLVTEIRMITAQTQQTVLLNSIEIGKRLTEAKQIIKHGKWADWLKERVEFSQRTANNLMKLYEEYGKTGLANSQTFANIGYSQALQLLALPSEDREPFVQKNNVTDMSIAQLKKMIQEAKQENVVLQEKITVFEKKEQEQKKQEAENQNRIEALTKKISSLEDQALQAEKNRDTEVQKQLEQLVAEEREKLKKAEQEKSSLLKEKEALISAHQKELNALQQAEKEATEKVLRKKDDEMRKATEKFNQQLEKLKEKAEKLDADKKAANLRARMAKEAVKCEYILLSLQQTYEDLEESLSRLRKLNSKTAEELKASISDVLTSMAERMEVKK